MSHPVLAGDRSRGLQDAGKIGERGAGFGRMMFAQGAADSYRAEPNPRVIDAEGGLVNLGRHEGPT